MLKGTSPAYAHASAGRLASVRGAMLAVEQAIHKYNHIRPHSSGDYLTPIVAHEQIGWLRKRWKKGQQAVDMFITQDQTNDTQ